MVDTHSHILWDLDDGPQTRGEALALCANAIADGVTAIVATPHVSRRFPTDFDQAASRLRNLSEGLGASSRLHLALGAELTAGMVASLSAPRLRDWSIGSLYLLIEVDNGWANRTIDLMSSIAARAGLTPVWAHPERWRALEKDPGLPRALFDAGRVQVTAPSLLGLTGSRTERLAWNLIASEYAHVVASDLHGSRVRPQCLGRAASLLEARFGAQARARLFVESPSAMVFGRSDNWRAELDASASAKPRD